MVRPTQQASAGEIFLRLGELEARGPANLAWCLGSLGRRGLPSLAALSGAFTRRPRAEHGPQEPGTVAWCPATLATAGTPLFGFVGELAQRLDLRESQPQNLTNILWNPGTLVLAKQTSCDALVAAAAGKMRELHAQNISNRAWSLATLVAGPRSTVTHLAQIVLSIVCDAEVGWRVAGRTSSFEALAVEAICCLGLGLRRWKLSFSCGWQMQASSAPKLWQILPGDPQLQVGLLPCDSKLTRWRCSG